MKSKRLQISNAVLIESSAEESDKIVVTAKLKDFSRANLNSERYDATAYDKFINDYYVVNNYNIPLTIQHGHDIQSVCGKVVKMERDDKSLSIVAEVYKDMPNYPAVSACLKHGILQGVSDDGFATDYVYDDTEECYIIHEAIILNVSLVTTPAEPTAGVTISNTAFSGFEEPKKTENKTRSCFRRHSK